MTKTFILFAIIGTFMPLVPLIIYWWTRKDQQPFMKWLIAFLLMSMLCDIVGMTSALWIKERILNFSALNVYLVTATICLPMFYRALLPASFGPWICGLMCIHRR